MAVVLYLVAFAILLAFLLIALPIFARDFKKGCVSHYSIFSYFFFITYAVSLNLGWLGDYMYSLETKKPVDSYYIVASVVAFTSWLAVTWGYKSKWRCGKFTCSLKNEHILKNRLVIFSCISVIFSAWFYIDEIHAFIRSASSSMQQKVDIFAISDGNGILVYAAGLYIYSFLAAGVFLMQHGNKKTVAYTFYCIAMYVLFMGLVLLTRRNFYIVLASILYVGAARGKVNFGRTLLLFILISPFLAKFADIIRYFDYSNYGILDESVFTDLTSIVSTYEGHWFAIYLEKVDTARLFLGNGMIAYVEAIFNYFPRIIWESKPYDLSVMGIQRFIVPDSFDSFTGKPIVSLPPTILTEVFYNFGLIIGMPVFYMIGYLLQRLEEWIEIKPSPTKIFISLCVFVFMFEFVRSGILFLVQILIFAIVFKFSLTKNSIDTRSH